MVITRADQTFVTFRNARLNPSDLLDGLHGSLKRYERTLKIDFNFKVACYVSDFVQATWNNLRTFNLPRSKLAVCISAHVLLNNRRDDHPAKQMTNCSLDASNIQQAMVQIFGLINTQDTAVEHSLKFRLSSVMGPPGTGKTFVMAVTLATQLLIQHFESVCPVARTIVLSPSNVAVEEQLAKQSCRKSFDNQRLKTSVYKRFMALTEGT
ncbi:hypothetical protein L596_024602 [Steinernema carpocapsae]|uniref:DNA2/NAM7 helicase helicase domain-containing protein n=1 Tax=Steinernema carpocapsae TaxID=34508 RepID=A0A4U5MH86_STECR|nr:hypothetical protein L596_024602 [Steinernema carpocapsae]